MERVARVPTQEGIAAQSITGRQLWWFLDLYRGRVAGLGNVAAWQFHRYINDTVAYVRYATADVPRSQWARHTVNSQQCKKGQCHTLFVGLIT